MLAIYRTRYRLLSTRYTSTISNNVAQEQSLPVMVFGSSTDVGKTIVSTGLCLAALNNSHKVCYFKPVQTGELDEYFIRLYANPQGTSDIFFRTLHHWTPATSPHVAAKLSDPNGNDKIVTDEDLVTGLNREIKAFVATSNNVDTFSIVETAGGVLSPGPSKSLQADIYRTLRLPVILVGDSKLGGITSTLCAFESLRLRGYRVSAIVMISKPGTDLYGNIPYLQEHLKKTFANSSTQIPGVYSLSPLPQGLLHDWFLENSNAFQKLFNHIETSTIEEMKGLEQMYNDGINCVWLPFSKQNTSKQNVAMIESAYGEYFRTLKPKHEIETNNKLVNTFDGIGSYWTQGIGHGSSSMATVIAEAAGRYGHVFFPSLHPPVVQLSRLLIDKIGRDHFHKVFYSDDGSTGVECALKMAFQLYSQRHKRDSTELFVLTQQGCSHTNAFGASSEGRHRNISIQVPCISYQKGSVFIDCADLLPITSTIQAVADSYINNSHVTNMKAIYDVTGRLTSDLSDTYRHYITQFLDSISPQSTIGALLIEPLMLGAAGMKFIDPLFQRLLVDEVKTRNISVIFDEVAGGLYRLGHITAGNILRVYPDIAVFGNMLTGGYLPLTVTLASKETYNSCDSKSIELSKMLRGNSFTANPISCVAALEAVRLLETCQLYDPEMKKMNDSFAESDIKILSKLPGVKSVMTSGSVLAISLQANINVDTVVTLLRENRIYTQPLNDVIYLMPTPFASSFDKDRLIRVMNRCLTNAYYIRSNSNLGNN